ncbi:MAG: hypothetical protein KDD69_00435 [Bdellovibrionales bacterium]|nr:hypothetical protein [Bdellovibrionales bacterium]
MAYGQQLALEEPISNQPTRFSQLDDFIRTDGTQDLTTRSGAADVLLSLILPPEPKEIEPAERIEVALPREAELPGRPDASRGLSEVESKISEVISARKLELEKLKESLLGKNHGLTDKQILNLSTEELVKLVRKGALSEESAIGGLSASRARDDSCVRTPVIKWLTPGYWSGEHELAAERVTQDRAYVGDLRRGIKELTTALKGAETELVEARKLAEQQLHLQGLANAAAERGDTQSVQSLSQEAARNGQALQSSIKKTIEYAWVNTDIDWRKHEQEFNRLNEREQEVADNRAIYDVVKNVAIISAAATTTALTGGVAGIFWGVALGGTLAFGTNGAEAAVKYANGMKVDWSKTLWDSAVLTGECALACVGGAWAGRSARAVAQTGQHAAQGLGILSKLNRWALGGRLGIQAQLPSTAFHAAQEVYSYDASKDPHGENSPLRASFWLAKAPELALAAFGGQLGAWGAGLRQQIAQNTGRGVCGAVVGQLRRSFLQAGTHGVEGFFNLVATEGQIRVNELYLGRELSKQEKQQMWAAAFTGLPMGWISASIPARNQALAERNQAELQPQVTAAREQYAHAQGLVLRPDAEVEVQIGARQGEGPSSTVRTGRHVRDAASHRRAEELNSFRSAALGADQVSGGSYRHAVSDAATRIKGALADSAHAGKMAPTIEERLKLGAVDLSKLPQLDARNPRSVKAYIEEFIKLTEAKMELHYQRRDAYRRGEGLDSGGPTPWLLRKLGAASEGTAARLDRVLDPFRRAYGDLVRPAPPTKDSGALKKLLFPVHSAVGQVLDYPVQWLKINTVFAPAQDALMKHTLVHFTVDALPGGRLLYVHSVLPVISLANSVGQFARRKLSLGTARPRDGAHFFADRVEFTDFQARQEQLRKLAQSSGLSNDPLVRQLDRVSENLARATRSAHGSFKECNSRHILTRFTSVPFALEAAAVSVNPLWMKLGWRKPSELVGGVCSKVGTGLAEASWVPRFAEPLRPLVKFEGTGHFLNGLGKTIGAPDAHSTRLLGAAYSEYGAAASNIVPQFSNFLRRYTVGWVKHVPRVEPRYGRVQDELAKYYRTGISHGEGIDSLKMFRALEERLTAGLNGSQPMKRKEFQQHLRLLYEDWVSPELRHQVLDRLHSRVGDEVVAGKRGQNGNPNARQRVDAKTAKKAAQKGLSPQSQNEHLDAQLVKVVREVIKDGLQALPAGDKNLTLYKVLEGHARAASFEPLQAELKTLKMFHALEERLMAGLDGSRRMKRIEFAQHLRLLYEDWVTPHIREDMLKRLESRVHDVVIAGKGSKKGNPNAKQRIDAKTANKAEELGLLPQPRDNEFDAGLVKVLRKVIKDGEQALPAAAKTPPPFKSLEFYARKGSVDAKAATKHVEDLMQVFGQRAVRWLDFEPPGGSQKSAGLYQQLVAMADSIRATNETGASSLVQVAAVIRKATKPYKHLQEEVIRHVGSVDENPHADPKSFERLSTREAKALARRVRSHLASSGLSVEDKLATVYALRQMADKEVSALTELRVEQLVRADNGTPLVQRVAAGLIADPDRAPIAHGSWRNAFRTFNPSARRQQATIRSAARKLHALGLDSLTQLERRVDGWIAGKEPPTNPVDKRLLATAADASLANVVRDAARAELIERYNRPQALIDLRYQDLLAGRVTSTDSKIDGLVKIATDKTATDKAATDKKKSEAARVKAAQAKKELRAIFNEPRRQLETLLTEFSSGRDKFVEAARAGRNTEGKVVSVDQQVAALIDDPDFTKRSRADVLVRAKALGLYGRSSRWLGVDLWDRRAISLARQVRELGLDSPQAQLARENKVNRWLNGTETPARADDRRLVDAAKATGLSAARRSDIREELIARLGKFERAVQDLADDIIAGRASTSGTYRRTLAATAGDATLPAGARDVARSRLIESLVEPRTKLKKLLEARDAERKALEQRIAKTVERAAEVRDPRVHNAKLLQSTLDRITVELRRQVSRDTASTRGRTLWDSSSFENSSHTLGKRLEVDPYQGFSLPKWIELGSSSPEIRAQTLMQDRRSFFSLAGQRQFWGQQLTGLYNSFNILRWPRQIWGALPPELKLSFSRVDNVGRRI